jgi:hypothetical protein
MAGQLDEAARCRAEIISPLVVANSSLDLDLTQRPATRRRGGRSGPVTIRQGEVIVRTGLR